jgi:GNAT superfamily N-acetyltransferase
VTRRAEPADAPALAALQVRSWWVAYGSFVAHEKIERAAARVPDAWAERLVDGTGVDEHDETWVSEHDGVLTGFIGVGTARDPDARPGDGEVRTIYVDPPRFGTGDGHALLERGEERLAALGFAAATLWVLSENGGARAFYERHGWTPDERPGENPYAEWGASTRYRKRLATPAAVPPPPPPAVPPAQPEGRVAI